MVSIMGGLYAMTIEEGPALDASDVEVVSEMSEGAGASDLTSST